MNENSIHPLTEDRAAELWDEHVPPQLNFQGWTWGDRRSILDALRAAYNAGSAEWKASAEAAAERAERAEDRLADSVHVDEAARRVEAAREEGWDDAAQHIYNKGWEGVTALRKANPHRPAPALPTEDGAVIIPADGHEYIVARVYNKTYRAREAVRHWAGGWHAAWRSGPEVRGVVAPEEITPGTWRTADDPR